MYELCVEHAIMIHKVTQWEGFSSVRKHLHVCQLCVVGLNCLCRLAAGNAGHSGGSFTQAV